MLKVVTDIQRKQNNNGVKYGIRLSQIAACGEAFAEQLECLMAMNEG